MPRVIMEKIQKFLCETITWFCFILKFSNLLFCPDYAKKLKGISFANKLHCKNQLQYTNFMWILIQKRKQFKETHYLRQSGESEY